MFSVILVGNILQLNIVDNIAQQKLSLFLQHYTCIDNYYILGYTPLCEAVWQQNANIVSKLLSNGARVTQSHRLLHYCAHNRCVSIAKMLLQHGSVSNLRDDTGDTPLLIAARTAQLDFVELLLQNGKY